MERAVAESISTLRGNGPPVQTQTDALSRSLAGAAGTLTLELNVEVIEIPVQVSVLLCVP